jgi:hypothetical protein
VFGGFYILLLFFGHALDTPLLGRGRLFCQDISEFLFRIRG